MLVDAMKVHDVDDERKSEEKVFFGVVQVESEVSLSPTMGCSDRLLFSEGSFLFVYISRF